MIFGIDKYNAYRGILLERVNYALKPHRQDIISIQSLARLGRERSLRHAQSTQDTGPDRLLAGRSAGTGGLCPSGTIGPRYAGPAPRLRRPRPRPSRLRLCRWAAAVCKAAGRRAESASPLSRRPSLSPGHVSPSWFGPPRSRGLAAGRATRTGRTQPRGRGTGLAC